MSKRAQFIVLCEDLQAQVFIRRALVHKGANARRIRIEKLPSEDEGAGDDYVMSKYPEQVRAFRTRSARTATGLVIHVDSDPRNSVADRHAQLADALAKSRQTPRVTSEAIAELVPKRNIETWIYALSDDLASAVGIALDEVTAFRKLKLQSMCDMAAKAFVYHAKQGTTPATAAQVPSLVDGLDEFRRLP